MKLSVLVCRGIGRNSRFRYRRRSWSLGGGYAQSPATRPPKPAASVVEPMRNLQRALTERGAVAARSRRDPCQSRHPPADPRRRRRKAECRFRCRPGARSRPSRTPGSTRRSCMPALAIAADAHCRSSQKALELKTRRPALAYFVRAMAYEDSGNLRAAYNDLQRAQATRTEVVRAEDRTQAVQGPPALIRRTLVRRLAAQRVEGGHRVEHRDGQQRVGPARQHGRAAPTWPWSRHRLRPGPAPSSGSAR